MQFNHVKQQTMNGVLAGVLLFAVGCSPIVAPADDSTNSPLPAAQEESPMPTVEAANSASPSALDVATSDLAERLSIEPGAIEVISVQDVAWRDSSMGCSQPGMMYAQMIVQGMRIVLAVDGQEYYYHSGQNSAPFLCEEPDENGAAG